MHTNFFRLTSFFLLFLALLSHSLIAKPSTSELSAQQLIKALQAGGHVLYMRHAMTDHNQKDQGVDRLDSCEKQRNLSVDGRQQAQQIGAKLSALKIPIGKVYSSPYCRCKDTAILTFGKMEIEKDLQFSMSKSPDESQYLGQRLKELMLSAKTDKVNTVFVGHTSNLKDGIGVWPKPEGVIVVFKINEGEVNYLGQLTPNTLLALQ
ncbi:histidine phosphatase family protein [Pseudoalteromonas sp.]|uniref:histidine phosphatase family protein n=1 Tax=Pseudoalteromonas sp. TaxID=53249 RepID=UPI0035613F3B